ncbi:MAG: YbhB/YbcL family Raf kinase inhibitor-like protein [Acidobacteriota bacterium]|nr:YbhB/YbcL family Raf kinase inhibitor-like protein [Acidobacteriota bacterium]
MRNQCAGVLSPLTEVAGFLLFALLAGTLAAPAPGRAAPAKLHLSSIAFVEGGFVPARYTCSGANISPALAWSGVPPGARSFVLIVTDPDAPGRTWVHWVAFNLPANMRSLPERIPKGDEIRGGGAQGVNDFRFRGYGGPCPPPGKAHRYFFRLYALNIRLSLLPGSTKAEVEQSMRSHILAEGELMARYGR